MRDEPGGQERCQTHGTMPVEQELKKEADSGHDVSE
jgi:hypothetical protein